MGDRSEIEWTHATWNPIRGCSRTIAAGATTSGCGDPTGGGCYAERNGWRFAGPGGAYEGLVRMTTNGPRWTGRVDVVDRHLLDPIRWERPRMIFTASVSDPYHERLSNSLIAALYGVMVVTPRHVHQVLTKRAERRAEWFNWVRSAADDAGVSPAELCFAELRAYAAALPARERRLLDHPDLARAAAECSWPAENIWEGISVEHQHAYMDRMPHLAGIEGIAVRFLSLEPLIGGVDLDPLMCPQCDQWEDAGDGDTPWCAACDAEMGITGWADSIGWAIAGCESGPRARACHVDWLRRLRDQCRRLGIPFFLKQAAPASCQGDEPIRLGSGELGPARRIISLPELDGARHAALPPGGIRP